MAQINLPVTRVIAANIEVTGGYSDVEYVIYAVTEDANFNKKSFYLTDVMLYNLGYNDPNDLVGKIFVYDDIKNEVVNIK